MGNKVTVTIRKSIEKQCNSLRDEKKQSYKARVVYRSFGNFSVRGNRGVSRRSGLRSYGVRRSPRDGVIKPLLEVSSRNRSFTLTTVTTREDSFARITLCTIRRYLSSFDNFPTNYEARKFRAIMLRLTVAPFRVYLPPVIFLRRAEIDEPPCKSLPRFPSISVS